MWLFCKPTCHFWWSKLLSRTIEERHNFTHISHRCLRLTPVLETTIFHMGFTTPPKPPIFDPHLHESRRGSQGENTTKTNTTMTSLRARGWEGWIFHDGFQGNLGWVANDFLGLLFFSENKIHQQMDDGTMIHFSETTAIYINAHGVFWECYIIWHSFPKSESMAVATTVVVATPVHNAFQTFHDSRSLFVPHIKNRNVFGPVFFMILIETLIRRLLKSSMT